MKTYTISGRNVVTMQVQVEAESEEQAEKVATEIFELAPEVVQYVQLDGGKSEAYVEWLGNEGVEIDEVEEA